MRMGISGELVRSVFSKSKSIRTHETNINLKKRKRAEFESDCESVGDNFNCFFKQETNQKMDHCASASASAPPAMFTFCWTDYRLNLLIDCYYEYLKGSACGAVRDLGSRERCLRQLKRAVNVKCTDVDDNCIEIKADDDTISQKLNELAEICGSKNEAGTRLRYIELKEILGKDRCNKLKILVQHEKFDYYSPLNEPSRRVVPATFVERSVFAFQSRNKFYWTDSKMQLLVTSYHSYLEKINNVTLTRGCRSDCLTFIKKSFGTVTFDELARKLDQIFDAEAGKGALRAQLRMRLGKETCGIFDKLLKNDPLYRTYYKPDVTSLSSLSSRKRSLTSRTSSSSMHRSESVQDQRDLNQEAARMRRELAKFELNRIEIADAMYELSNDEVKRAFFWGCDDDEERRQYVRRCINKTSGAR